ncbi:MAG: DUF1836 domain-containing protein [Bacillota bacterium]|nr:DUF1836 domain-containing protein [Bacillota bacterium]
MNFDDDTIKKLIDSITACDEIKLSDIPCIDLYMDQVTTLFNDKLKSFKRDENDKLLTKTMINNYTKSKILMSAKNKKYTKQHIILLILTYNLKQMLSINDIHDFFAPILKNVILKDENSNILDDIYSSFLEMKAEEMDNFKKNIFSKINLIKEKDFSTKDKSDNELIKLMLLVLMLNNEATLLKRMSEKLIDTYFKAP